METLAKRAFLQPSESLSQFGVLKNQVKRMVDSRIEFSGNSGAGLCEVVIDSAFVIDSGRWMPTVFHAPASRSFLSISARTSSPGINSTFPDSISSIRRAISASHAACTDSRDLTLTHSQSARSARASGGEFHGLHLDLFDG